MLRFINAICFFLAIAIAFVFYKQDRIHITQEVLDLFPVTEDRKIVDIYQEFSESKFVYVAVKGFSSEASDTLNAFLDEIKALDNIADIKIDKKPNDSMQGFFTSYYPLITPHKDMAILKPQEIMAKIQVGLDSINSFNPLDPLGAFESKNGNTDRLSIKDYGYMAFVELKHTDSDSIISTLNSFENIASKYKDIRFFSAKFMSSKNLDLILNEVTYLTGFASLVFITLYFIIIRIPLLTINTIFTLIFSNTIAILIVSSVYDKVTIMAISFGIGISNIAIDYMMHHNFFSLYANGSRELNKPVLYGYVTTIIGFGACLFIPFPLLAQLSLYAIISLSISYICFALLYPRIGFSEPRLFMKMANLRFPCISSVIIGLVSCVLFALAFSNIKLDFDLSKLDYQNKEMLKERDFFTKALGDDVGDIVLSASNIDSLISNAKVLQEYIDSKNTDWIIPLATMPTKEQMNSNKEFIESNTMQANIKTLQGLLPNIQRQLSSSIKDKEQLDSINKLFGIMQTSYKAENIPSITKELLESFGFNIVQDSNAYYYLVSMPKELIANIPSLENSFVETRSLQSIMDSITDSIYQPMLVVLFIAFALMTLALVFTARKAFIDSYVFILFPLSSALFAVSLHSELNLMHLFALLILVVVSIDYGIYSVKEGSNPRTAHAIFFSSITTGLSFGILITSNTKALNSFGEILFIGMCCVLFMLVFHKPLHKEASF